MVVGEAWGYNESVAEKAFVGAAGKEMNAMLAEAGINPAECFFTNLVAAKPSGNDMKAMLLPIERGKLGLLSDGMRPNTVLQDGLELLDRQIEFIRPDIIIACGNWPLWWLTRKANVKTDYGYKLPVGIGSWRGSQLYLTESPFRKLSGIPVLPIYHPAAILRMFRWRKITVQDLRRAAVFYAGKMAWDDTKKRNNVIIPTADFVEKTLEEWLKLPSQPTICDVETKKYRLHIVGLSRNELNMSIPFFHITKDGFRPAYSPKDFERIWYALFNFFMHPEIRLVGQNFGYDLQYISKFFHCVPKCEHDTMVAQHVMFPDNQKALDFMSSMYCAHHVYWKDDLKESTDTFNTEQACLYNCVDLYKTDEIYQSQVVILEQLNKTPQFRRRMRVFPILIKMMNKGTLINDRLRTKQKADLMNLAFKIQTWLDGCLPDSLRESTIKSPTPWYASTYKLMEILYDKLKLKVVYGKEGGRSTDKEALVWLGERYPHYRGLFSAVIILRSIGVIANNFLSSPLDSEGRARTEYKLSTAITFRLASAVNVWGQGANLQNIPRDRDAMDLLEQELI